MFAEVAGSHDPASTTSLLTTCTLADGFAVSFTGKAVGGSGIGGLSDPSQVTQPMAWLTPTDALAAPSQPFP